MKHFLLSIILAVLTATVFAQAPQALNYQGIARTNSGTPINNQTIKLRLSIQPATGNAWYVETHTVQTSQLGLYAVKIGQGTVESGSFSAIPWSAATTLLQVEMDPAGGNNFTLVGVPTQLVSVPYALEANHAASATLNGDVSGSSAANTVTALQNRPVAPVAPATGDVLKWNGSQWQPGADATSGGGAYSAGSGISISGNIISNNGDLSNTNEIQSLTLNGQVLNLSNGGGSVTLPAGGGTYNEGPGIEINGNTISNSGDLDNTNELQSISLSGNTLTLSDGGGSVNLPTSNYNEGVGIEINGNIISNAGDLDNTNELQSISLSGNVLTLSDGGGSVTLPTGGGGSGYWASFGGGDITNTNSGTIFTGGPGTPFQSIFASVSNNSQTIVAQQNGSGAAIYAESLGGTAISAQAYWTGVYGEGGIGLHGVNSGSVSGFGVFGETTNQFGTGGVFRNDFGGNGLEVTGKIRILTPTGGGGFLPVLIEGMSSTSALQFYCGLRPYQDNIYALGASGARWSTVYAANGAINTSDARQKQNIQPVGYGLQQVMAMKPVSFEWIKTPEQGRKLGFLAQDLQQIVPEVVADKEWHPDAEGKMVSKPAEALGVYYSDLIPVLTKAIQEQQVMIEKLKAENEALKAENDARFRKMEAEMAALKAAVLKAEK